MKYMKILIDLTSLADNFSGIERYALNISKELLIQDNLNKYILLFKNEVHKEFDKFKNRSNIEFKVIKGKNKLVFNQIILPYYLYSMKADKYLFLAFPSPILFRKKGIINTIHDLTAWDYPDTMKVSSRLYFKASIINSMKISEKIVTVSEFSKSRIEDKFRKNNVHIVYNGISEVFINNKEKNFKYIKEKYNLPDSYIMCLCTLEPRKNIQLLIKAYMELKIERKIDLKLVLVGRKGWKIENLLREVNNRYSDEIIITGFVDDDDLPLIYKNSEMFIFPSLYEGFGIPVIEAMYMRVPVICSNTSSLPEVVDGKGLLFNNNDKDDLKDKILNFIRMSKEDINSIKEAARVRANDFKWEDEAKKLINLYNYN